MTRKHLFIAALFTSSVIAISCGSNSNQGNAGTSGDTAAVSTGSSSENAPANPEEEKSGVGKFKNVQLTHPLDQGMVTKGKSIYDLKCGSCHKLTDEKLVGPGWKGVTDRRTPEWIMNFVTNTEEMINKNKAAQSMLEICMVKMPNQNLSDDDARAILEFMRNNDGKK